jgi:hypothetical protein
MAFGRVPFSSIIYVELVEGNHAFSETHKARLVGLFALATSIFDLYYLAGK